MDKRRLSVLLFAICACAASHTVPARDGSAGITAEQRAQLAERLASVERLLAAAGAHRAGTELTAERQRWLRERLYRMSLSELRTIELRASVDELVREIDLVRPKRDSAKLGQPDSELVYVPITPCRFADTRNLGVPLSGTRAFDLDASGSDYGGSAMCNPASAAANDANLIGAIALNLTIVSPTVAPGFVGARPAGASSTTSLVNWHQSGPSVQAANAGVVTTDQGGGPDEIEVFGSPTHFIIDVFGVFAAPTASALECRDVFTSGTIPASGTLFLTVSCPAGWTRTSGGLCQHGSVNYFDVVLSKTSNATASAHPNGPTAACAFGNQTAVPISGYAGVTCCRSPGR